MSEFDLWTYLTQTATKAETDQIYRAIALGIAGCVIAALAYVCNEFCTYLTYRRNITSLGRPVCIAKHDIDCQPHTLEAVFGNGESIQVIVSPFWFGRIAYGQELPAWIAYPFVRDGRLIG